MVGTATREGTQEVAGSEHTELWNQINAFGLHLKCNYREKFKLGNDNSMFVLERSLLPLLEKGLERNAVEAEMPVKRLSGKANQRLWFSIVM